jgi:hypothetical protein
MGPKEFLQEYRSAVAEERRIASEMKELREWADSVQSSVKGFCFSPRELDEKPFPALVEEIIEAELHLLRKAQGSAIAARMDVVFMIESVPNSRYRELLSYRYISMRTWDWIAETMNCDRTTVFRWHSNALELLKVATVCDPKKE